MEFVGLCESMIVVFLWWALAKDGGRIEKGEKYGLVMVVYGMAEIRFE